MINFTHQLLYLRQTITFHGGLWVPPPPPPIVDFWNTEKISWPCPESKRAVGRPARSMYRLCYRGTSLCCNDRLLVLILTMTEFWCCLKVVLTGDMFHESTLSYMRRAPLTKLSLRVIFILRLRTFPNLKLPSTYVFEYSWTSWNNRRVKRQAARHVSLSIQVRFNTHSQAD